MRSLTFIILLVLWQGAMTLFHVESYVVPQPIKIAQMLYEQRNILLIHSVVSFTQIILGLMLGSILALLTSILLDAFKKIENFTLSYLIALKNLPIFVLAPIFFIWFGYGLSSKVILITLSCYFPMTLALLDGLKHTPKHAHELLQGLPQIHYFPTLFYVRLPYAMPSFFTGLKLAFLHAPMSVIACDWIGAHSGLGYLLMLSYGRMDIELMFAVLFLLLFYGIFLYKIAHFLQKFGTKCLHLYHT